MLATLPFGFWAESSGYDSGDPMVRDEGWGDPAAPADLALPFDPVDARTIEKAMHSMGDKSGHNKPGHVWTLTQCYVREVYVNDEARLRAEFYLLGVLH